MLATASGVRTYEDRTLVGNWFGRGNRNRIYTELYFLGSKTEFEKIT